MYQDQDALAIIMVHLVNAKKKTNLDEDVACMHQSKHLVFWNLAQEISAQAERDEHYIGVSYI